MLTEVQVRNAKASNKTVRIFDGYGMYLEIAPSGSKWWRLKYRHLGKEKRLSLGVYPETGLKGARARRDDARRLLANGVDPSENRKAVRASQIEQAGNSFEVVAREWFEKYSVIWAENHSKRIIRRLEKDVFPWLGARPIADIKAMDLLTTIRKLEKRDVLETAHRTLATCGQIFRYAVATGRAERDPSGDLRGAIPPVKGEHFAAVTDPKKVGELLKVLDGYQGSLIVQSALALAPLVFVRPGELRTAQWADIDFENAEWRYTVSKTNTAHVVPLARQAVTILETMYGLTGKGQYVFPSARSRKRPMSDNAILAAMRRMGISKDEMSGHGFRAMARTIPFNIPPLSQPKIEAKALENLQLTANENSFPAPTSPYLQAAISNNTRRAYRSDLAHFTRWGGIIPAGPEVVTAYITDYAGTVKAATLARRLALRYAFLLGVCHPSRGRWINTLFVKSGPRPISRKRSLRPRDQSLGLLLASALRQGSNRSLSP